MAKKKRLGLFRQMTNVSGWMGLQNLKQTSSNIAKDFKDLRQVPEATIKETFEEAVHRMGLDEDAIARRIKQCYYTGWFYFGAAILLFIYGIYLILHTGIIGAFISWILTVFALALAYRESFWYFQMTVRKLGCSFAEYKNFLIGGKK